jgi:sugar lactone lactonase YvrE
MRKSAIVIFLSMLLLAGSASGQNWEFDHLLLNFPLPPSDTYGIHGVAVAPDGNIWVVIHGNLAQDTLFTGGDTLNTRPIYVLDPNGNHVSFSPIRWLDFPDGSRDTLNATAKNGSGVGISVDNDGNILASSFATLYRIDYQTGAGMNKWEATDATSLTEAVQDENGNIYVGHVLSGARPLFILDNDFNLIGNAIDTVGYIHRSLAISPDGTDLYTGPVWNSFGIAKWHSDFPGLVQYTLVDTLGIWESLTVQDSLGNDTTYHNFPIWASSLDWGPDGYLWAGMLKSVYSNFGSFVNANKGSMYYVIDVDTDTRVDSVGDPYPADSSAGGIYSPRGAAWTADGATMYLADFDYNIVGVWTKVTGIDQISDVPRTFNLFQNYPNPFNPTTTIPFALGMPGFVELKVFNVQGQLVETLVNEQLTPGNYTVEFDAGELASGAYYYQLKSNGRTMSKRMMLIK